MFHVKEVVKIKKRIMTHQLVKEMAQTVFVSVVSAISYWTILVGQYWLFLEQKAK